MWISSLWHVITFACDVCTFLHLQDSCIDWYIARCSPSATIVTACYVLSVFIDRLLQLRKFAVMDLVCQSWHICKITTCNRLCCWLIEIFLAEGINCSSLYCKYSLFTRHRVWPRTWKSQGIWKWSGKVRVNRKGQRKWCVLAFGVPAITLFNDC